MKEKEKKQTNSKTCTIVHNYGSTGIDHIFLEIIIMFKTGQVLNESDFTLLVTMATFLTVPVNSAGHQQCIGSPTYCPELTRRANNNNTVTVHR